MEVKKIEEFKKGDIVRLVKKDGSMQKRTYIYTGYCRFAKGYCLDAWDDISVQKVVKKGTLATDDFIF